MLTDFMFVRVDEVPISSHRSLEYPLCASGVDNGAPQQRKHAQARFFGGPFRAPGCPKITAEEQNPTSL